METGEENNGNAHLSRMEENRIVRVACLKEEIEVVKNREMTIWYNHMNHPF